MAYPPTRSMNSDLIEGATDGKYKKVLHDRGGQVELTSYEQRADLHDLWYGIHESPVKRTPDGRTVHTAYFEPSAPATATN